MKKKYCTPNTLNIKIGNDELMGFIETSVEKGPEVHSDETVDPGQSLSKHNSIWEDDEESEK